MTIDPNETPGIAPALARGLTQQRLSRRSMLKIGGMSVGALSLSQILAACAGNNSTSSAGGGSGAPAVNFDPSQAGGSINFSNWPLYIDRSHGDYPSLDKFKQETGIEVTYNDEINDNAQFFGELLPQFQAGQDTGRDIIVITNGEYLTALIANGWATEIDASRHPNFDKNAASWAVSPAYDPNNAHTMAWQSGLTGLGYNTELVLQTPTKLDDMMSTDYFPPSSVGVLKADAPDLVMINLGINPVESTPDQWKQAADWLTQLRDSDTFYFAYDQDYINDLNAKNLSGTMAWSGDVLYYKIWGGKPYEFIMPADGALLWIDNMLIPANSANPAGALELMDFFYDPANAQMVTEWVLYMSPVPAVQQLIEEHSKQETGKFAEQLDATAQDPMLWPDEALLSKVSLGRPITNKDESEEWHNTFDTIWEQ